MDIITYIDSIGRTCFGELEERTDDGIKVKSPAMIMVTPNDASNMKVDVMPLFFTEFSDGKPAIFSYKNSQFVEVLINKHKEGNTLSDLDEVEAVARDIIDMLGLVGAKYYAKGNG